MRTIAITAAPRPRHRSLRERLRAGLRVTWCVLALLGGAVEAWLTALIGLAPVSPRLRRLATVIADECRTCAAGAIDAEIIDDLERPEREVWR